MKKRDYYLLFFSLILSLGAGAAGSIFTSANILSWYDFLNKPFFSPPNWLFAPVWTILYILMGLALFLVWRQGWHRDEVKRGLKLFLIQLGFNVIWSYFFFGLHEPRLAFLEIIALWLAIAATIISFYRVDKRAAWLLLPYLLWVSFAAFLNYAFWQLNP
ncbi:MAG: tryptophan-rich sensory protein [Patescibacteria group bacterium]|nr:tryptophan-rich sensory protein [Patescibacteria group bacterium]